MEQVERYRRLAHAAMGRARASASAFERTCWLEIADSYETLANERQALISAQPAKPERSEDAPHVLGDGDVPGAAAAPADILPAA